MATLGHVAVALAAARLHAGRAAPSRDLVRRALAFSAVSLAPDLDVIGMSLGVPNEHALAHRGATHALILGPLAGALVLAAGAFTRKLHARAAALVAVVLMSHGPLDAMVDGGCAPALLWPWTSERYWAPWRPIPQSPIGLYLLSPRGAYVLAVELVLFLPLIVFALRTRSVRA